MSCATELDVGVKVALSGIFLADDQLRLDSSFELLRKLGQPHLVFCKRSKYLLILRSQSSMMSGKVVAYRLCSMCSICKRHHVNGDVELLQLFSQLAKRNLVHLFLP